MKVFLVSTNDSAWLVSAECSADAMYRLLATEALNGEGPLQVTSREYSESAWMALVSSTVSERLRRSVNLAVCGHEALLDVLATAPQQMQEARELLNEAHVAFNIAADSDIVCVRTIPEAE